MSNNGNKAGDLRKGVSEIKDKIKDYFEKEVLKNTCFDSLEELLKDRTLVEVNSPRALIACNLLGVWRGLNLMKELSSKGGD